MPSTDHQPSLRSRGDKEGPSTLHFSGAEDVCHRPGQVIGQRPAKLIRRLRQTEPGPVADPGKSSRAGQADPGGGMFGSGSLGTLLLYWPFWGLLGVAVGVALQAEDVGVVKQAVHGCAGQQGVGKQPRQLVHIPIARDDGGTQQSALEGPDRV